MLGKRLMRDTYTQMLRIGLAIVALALLLYWVDASYFAPKRIPPCRQETLPPDRICLDTLHAHWKGKVVWIDARSLSDYELNHLMFSEARMFPIRPNDFDQLFDRAVERLIKAEEQGECIVVFCTKTCASAEEVARRLRESAFISAPVYVLEGGWDTIKSDKSLLP